MTLIAHHLESIPTKSTQKLLHFLELPEKQLLCAPDSLQYGLQCMLVDEQSWLMLWSDCLKKAGDRAIFVDEESLAAARIARSKLVDCSCELLSLSHYLLRHKPLLEKKAMNKRWKEFDCALCSSSFAMFACLSDDVDLLNWLGLHIKHKNCATVSQFSAFNFDGVLHENARVYYEMVDCGIDLIVSNAWSTFAFFEKHAKSMQKAMRRDVLDTPILHISEVVLLALNASVATHKIPLGML